MFSKQERRTRPSFSHHQLTVAAELWAAYLPGGVNVSFDEINQFAGIDDTDRLLTRLTQDNRRQGVTRTQKQAFINFLREEMPLLDCETRLSRLAYIQIGQSSSYDPPDILSKALEQAGIPCAPILVFPFKSVMRIYANGTIAFNGNVIRTNPDEIHYDANTNLDTAPFMVITGKKFKLFELPYTSEDLFYEGRVGSKSFGLEAFSPATQDAQRRFGQIHGERIKYVRVNIDDFNGTEADLLAMSEDDFRIILHDPVKIKAHFTNNAYIIFNSEKQLQTSYSDIGTLDAVVLGDNYYQESMGVVRVLSVPKNGTVALGHNYLEPVTVKDFVVYCDKTAQPMVVLTKHHDLEARLCDTKGTILSEHAFKPGMDLLLLHNEQSVDIINTKELSPRTANPVSTSQSLWHKHPIWQAPPTASTASPTPNMVASHTIS